MPLVITVDDDTRFWSWHRVHAWTVLRAPPWNAFASVFDPDVNDVLALTNVAGTSLLGAAVRMVNGHVEYDPTGVASLLGLPPGSRVTDRFSYTVTDLLGQTASASVEVDAGGSATSTSRRSST